MKLNLKNIRNNLIKTGIFFSIMFPVMFYLNAGSLTDSYWEIIQSVFFAIVFTIILIWPQLKKAIFWLGLILIIITAAFYIVSLIDWADMAGSTAFGLLIINLFGYLPQIVKLGYIKKL